MIERNMCTIYFLNTQLLVTGISKNIFNIGRAVWKFEYLVNLIENIKSGPVRTIDCSEIAQNIVSQ